MRISACALGHPSHFLCLTIHGTVALFVCLWFWLVCLFFWFMGFFNLSMCTSAVVQQAHSVQNPLLRKYRWLFAGECSSVTVFFVVQKDSAIWSSFCYVCTFQKPICTKNQKLVRILNNDQTLYTPSQYFRKNISLLSLPSQKSQAPINASAGFFSNSEMDE